MYPVTKLIGKALKPAAILLSGIVLLKILLSRRQNDIADDRHQCPLEGSIRRRVSREKFLRQGKSHAVTFSRLAHFHLLVVGGGHALVLLGNMAAQCPWTVEDAITVLANELPHARFWRTLSLRVTELLARCLPSLAQLGC